MHESDESVRRRCPLYIFSGVSVIRGSTVVSLRYVIIKIFGEKEEAEI